MEKKMFRSCTPGTTEMTQQVNAFAVQTSWLQFDPQNPLVEGGNWLFNFVPWPAHQCLGWRALSPPPCLPPSLPPSLCSLSTPQLCVSLSVFHNDDDDDDDNNEEDNKIKTKTVKGSCLFPPASLVYTVRFHSADFPFRVLNRLITVESRNAASRIFSLQECSL